MLPYSQNPHLIADLGNERYKDLRREADAWRLSREAQNGAQAPCASASSRLKAALMTLRLRLTGAQPAQLAACP